MRNQIIVGVNNESLYAAFLYSYEETPSGHTRAILRVSSQFVFDSPADAANHLFNNLKPEIAACTDIGLLTEVLVCPE